MLRFLIGLMLATPALADTAEAFRAGRWADAVRQGEAENTAQSRLLAGRARLWLAGYDTPDKDRALALVTAAEADFDAALARTPADPQAQLQKAVAIGYRAKLTRSPGLAKQARDRFLAVRTAHPDLALAWSAVAGWHGGSVATLGSFTAGLVLGARTKDFETGYARALQLEPRNPAWRTLYALGLMDLKPGNASRAAAILKGIETLPAADAFESRLRAQGVTLAEALADRPSEAQAVARRLSAFGGLK
ncbi:hypothetical protein [Polymorphobacter sp.]|uniref:hypothetical protein n=1 Tax=Polymorphobacter sp. TaxID=1909290 RepID=UPI003F6F9A64